jgi:hypothetical protein
MPIKQFCWRTWPVNNSSTAFHTCMNFEKHKSPCMCFCGTEYPVSDKQIEEPEVTCRLGQHILAADCTDECRITLNGKQTTEGS